jgi:hypothetical protein
MYHRHGSPHSISNHASRHHSKATQRLLSRSQKEHERSHLRASHIARVEDRCELLVKNGIPHAADRGSKPCRAGTSVGQDKGRGARRR